MGVDYSAMLMYGVEVESFEYAVRELKRNNVISDEQEEEIINDGEIYQVENIEDISYQAYSYYSEEGGVLGTYLTLDDINTPALEEIKNKIDKLLPKSKCRLHHFVQVH